MTAAIGYGLTFEVETAPGSGTYFELVQVFTAQPPVAEVDQVETTHFKSPNRSREYIPALSDRGAASAQMNFVPNSATDVFLEAMRADATTRAIRITYETGVTVTFSGFITSYSADPVPVDDRMTATANFKVSGNVTTAAAAAPTNTLAPAISGTPQVGEVLTALEGVWTGTPAFTYQWQADTAGNGSFVSISGATSRTYTLAVGEQGDSVRVQVTGTNSAGNSTASSAGTALVAAA